MKKLLGILGTIAVAGSGISGIVGNAPTSMKNKINYSQTNDLEKLNRSKRGVNCGNEIEYNEWNNNIYTSFKPEMWEEITFLYTENFKENFANKFKDKMFGGVWMDWRIENHDDIKHLGKTIYENFSTINNKFRNSSRRERIRIVVLCKWTGWEIWNDGVSIRTDDSNYYPNKYLNLDLFDVIADNQLGLLNDNNDQTIIEAVKAQNNLANLTYTIRNKTNNSAEFWIANDNDHYITWSWKKVYFEIVPVRHLQSNNNEITKITESLNINYDGNNYISSFNRIINELINQNVLNVIFENEDREIYEINQNSSKWFRISVSVDNRNIDLVFRTSDLYVEGFIVNNTFFHFLDSSITSIPNTNSVNLNFNSNYNALISGNPSISWPAITQAFNDLINYGENPNSSNSIAVIRGALARVVLATSESIRFKIISDLIRINVIANNQNIYWNPEANSGQTNIHNIVTNWQSTSNYIIDAINNIRERFGANSQSINELFYNLLSRIPTFTIGQTLSISGVRVILGLIMRPQLNCNTIRNPRNVNNINIKIKKEYCDITEDASSGDTIENQKLTVVKVFDEKTAGKSFQAGDIFIGTTRGLYHSYKRENKNNFKKIPGLDYKINKIKLYNTILNNNYADIETDTGMYQITLSYFGNYSVTQIYDEL